MKLKKVKYTPTFFKSLKKVPKTQRKYLVEKEKLFRENPFHSRLKTHRLKGKLSGQYSFSVSHHWRIVFHFEKEDVVIFDNIGTHAVYK